MSSNSATGAAIYVTGHYNSQIMQGGRRPVHKVTKFHFKRMFYVTLCHLKESIIGPDTPADRRPERVGDVNDKLADEILHCNRILIWV